MRKNKMAIGWKLIVSSLTILSSSLILLIKSTTASSSSSSSSSSSLGNLERCGGRLERALDALQRDLPRKNRLDEEEAGIVYQEKLESAPLEMIVSRIAVKLPQDSRNRGSLWARVERCAYEPNTNALRTRVMFNDLSVSGLISLLPRDYRASAIPAETCRMSLRLRRAGIDFHTSPIARGRGQMRIRTESSFLEPRFASIYAFGCRPAGRVDKQIKRYDNRPPTAQSQHIQHETRPASVGAIEEPYDAPEPREIAGLTKEEDLTIANEMSSARIRALDDFDANLGIWRKNVWVTKIPPRRDRRAGSTVDRENKRSNSSEALNLDETSPKLAGMNSSDLILALAGRATNNLAADSTKLAKKIIDFAAVAQDAKAENSNESSAKNSWKRETTPPDSNVVDRRREREFVETDFDQSLDQDPANRNDYWQSREAVTNEMEDVFLRGASQALTRYIERELHPAIKETLMLSMGYTISYG